MWGQTFVSDAFGNTTKIGSSAWQPTYNTKNQYASLPSFTPTYDANGDLVTDSFHTYKWDAEGHVTAIDSIGLAYDALARMVEQNPSSGTYYQIVYTPMGSKLAVMKGQTIQQAFVPLPGGTTAEYLSWGLSYYRHPDWLGSERLESSTSHSILQDTAYAPFGEPYAELSGGNGDLSFTGQNKDTDWLNFDFMYREYDPRQGRWLSPDPSGLAAVDPSDPQSWNRYAYVENNPLSFTDPLGLQHPACFNTRACNPAWQSWSDAGWLGDGPDASSAITNFFMNGTGPIGTGNGHFIFREQPHCRNADLLAGTPGFAFGGLITGQSNAANTDSPAWAFTKTLFSLQPQVDAWNKGYYKCLAKTAAGGATAPVVTHAAGVAATNAVENGASTIAGAYYHFTDARFTAWGKYSQGSCRT